jgi:hypothetical protein
MVWLRSDLFTPSQDDMQLVQVRLAYTLSG